MAKNISTSDQIKCQVLHLEQMAEPGGNVEMVKLTPPWPFETGLEKEIQPFSQTEDQRIP